MILNTAAISFCFSLAALTLLQGSSCPGSNSPNSKAIRINSSSPATELPSGRWGGLHVGMEISDKGAELNFDCAHGTITEKLVTDNVGRFVAKGIYVREHPGAMRQEENPAGTNASYQGTIKEETMKLTVILPDTNETAGTFSLTRGNAGKVRKCM
jgi:hypothetical protein